MFLLTNETNDALFFVKQNNADLIKIYNLLVSLRQFSPESVVRIKAKAENAIFIHTVAKF